MKKFIPLLLLAGFSSPAMATITNKLSSSVQLSVAAAATQVERVGTTYSVSGSGIDTTYTPTGGSAVSDGIGSLTISSGVGAIPSIEATQKTAGSAFSFSQSFTQGVRYLQMLPQLVLWQTIVMSLQLPQAQQVI